MRFELSPVEPRWATDEEEAEYQREVSRQRPHCPVCGAFAKPGPPPRMDMNGEYQFSVFCKNHGKQWIV